jgi:hypothetical protein
MDELQPQQSQVPTPASMHSRRYLIKGLVAGLIVVGILVAGCLAYVYYAYSIGAGPFSPWKIYTNEQHGFRFRYTRDLRAVEFNTPVKGGAGPEMEYVMRLERAAPDFEGHAIFLEIYEIKGDMISVRSRYHEEEVERPIIIAGQPAYIVEVMREGKVITGSGNIYIPHGNIVYEVIDQMKAPFFTDPILATLRATFSFTK